MYTCMVEYRIDERHRASFLAWIGEKRSAHGNFVIYEGTDQPGLFVEVWTAGSSEEADAIKKERCDQRSSWREMSAWVPGGAAKIHAWVFRVLQ